MIRLNLITLVIKFNIKTGSCSPDTRIYLRNGVRMANHVDDVIQRQERVALDLGEDVLAHGAAGQQPDQLDVVTEW